MKWVFRILGGLAAAFAVLFVVTLLFGEKVIPRCDSRTALDTVRQVVIGNMNEAVRQGLGEDELKAAITFAKETELRFEEEPGLRECTATLTAKVKEQVLFDAVAIAYTMTWKDKKEGIFQTRVERMTGN